MRGLNLKEIMSKSNMNQQGLNIATYGQAYSTPFLCVCSLEQNAGKVYWQLILSVAVCPPGNHPTNPYSALAKMTGVV